MSLAAPVVLVLDDDEDAASLLGMALRRKGFRVVLAGSCAEARRSLAGGTVDGIVTDVVLPDGSGLDLVGSLDAPPRALVVVSGYGGEAEREKSRTAGAHAHLVKPVDVGKLVSTLSGLLGRAG